MAVPLVPPAYLSPSPLPPPPAAPSKDPPKLKPAFPLDWGVT